MARNKSKTKCKNTKSKTNTKKARKDAAVARRSSRLLARDLNRPSCSVDVIPSDDMPINDDLESSFSASDSSSSSINSETSHIESAHSYIEFDSALRQIVAEISEEEKILATDNVESKMCVPECLYNGDKEHSKTVTCFLCMSLFHPDCCGGPDEMVHNGPFSCTICRQMGKKVIRLEQQIENMHTLNKDLILLLEKSHRENENLRILLQESMLKGGAYIVEKDTRDSIGSGRETSNEGLQVDRSVADASDTDDESTDGKAESKSSEPKLEKPIPKPRRKPKLTLVGNSMVRNTGAPIKQNCATHDTCVLSESGLSLDKGTCILPNIVEGYSQRDTIMIHLGTTDIENVSNKDFTIQYFS